MSDKLQDMLTYHIDLLVKQKAAAEIIINEVREKNVLKQAVSKSDDVNRYFKKTIDKFCKLPAVTANVEELQYIGIVLKSFDLGYYSMRGLNAALKDKEPISREIFEQAILVTEPLRLTVPFVIQKYYNHDLSEMVKSKK